MEIAEELIQELTLIQLLPPPSGGNSLAGTSALPGTNILAHMSAEEIESQLAEKLNGMIRDDFNGLVQLLYRIDVEEPRLRYLLQQHKGEDAGRIIARLIIDRLLKKIETRRQYSAKKNDIPDEESW